MRLLMISISGIIFLTVETEGCKTNLVYIESTSKVVLPSKWCKGSSWAGDCCLQTNLIYLHWSAQLCRCILWLFKKVLTEVFFTFRGCSEDNYKLFYAGITRLQSLCLCFLSCFLSFFYFGFVFFIWQKWKSC